MLHCQVTSLSLHLLKLHKEAVLVRNCGKDPAACDDTTFYPVRTPDITAIMIHYCFISWPQDAPAFTEIFKNGNMFP